jgi:hypothetical protein
MPLDSLLATQRQWAWSSLVYVVLYYSHLGIDGRIANEHWASVIIFWRGRLNKRYLPWVMTIPDTDFLIEREADAVYEYEKSVASKIGMMAP